MKNGRKKEKSNPRGTKLATMAPIDGGDAGAEDDGPSDPVTGFPFFTKPNRRPPGQTWVNPRGWAFRVPNV